MDKALMAQTVIRGQSKSRGVIDVTGLFLAWAMGENPDLSE